MKPFHATRLIRTFAFILASGVLLGACGQTGALYMPETHSDKAPPPPREIRRKQVPQNTSGNHTDNHPSQTDNGK